VQMAAEEASTGCGGGVNPETEGRHRLLLPPRTPAAPSRPRLWSAHGYEGGERRRRRVRGKLLG
jgi:hypothetical protein